MSDGNVHESVSIHDDYVPDGSPRAKQRRIDELLNKVSVTETTLRGVSGLLDSHTQQFTQLNSALKEQSLTLQDIAGQIRLLVEQFSRLETKRQEETGEMHKQIAQLKKTVHAELLACRESINKEVKTYLLALDNDRERDTLSFEL